MALPYTQEEHVLHLSWIQKATKTKVSFDTFHTF
jgi:hypothetical protein